MVLVKWFFKNAVWFGIGLGSAGLTSGVIAGFGAISIGLTIAGCVLIGIWFLLLGYWDGDAGQPKFWQRRSTQVGSGALVSTIAMLVILGLLNLLSVRNLYRVDLTDTGRFTLSPETQEVLKNIKQPLTLYVFDKQPMPEDRELLQNFRRQNPNFAFEFIDPNASPDLAKKFEIKNSTASRDVHLELPSKNRRQFVQSIAPQQRLSESRLVNSLIAIQSDRKPRIYFTQGHGERSLEPGDKNYSLVVKALQDKNFEVLPLNLAQTAKVPPDAALLVLAGPSKPFFEAELQAVQEYLNQAGNWMVLVDPEAQPNLDGLLKTWGIVLDNRVAIDASGTGQLFKLGPAAPIVQDYNSNAHPITKEFAKNISFYPLARPLEIQSVQGVVATPIALTNEKSWGESNLQEKPVKLDNGDRPGPLPLVVALSRQIQVLPPQPTPSPTPNLTPSPRPNPKTGELEPPSTPEPIATPTPNPTASPTPTASPRLVPTPKESRLVVFGNSTFATDQFLLAQINGDVFLNSLTWASQTDGQALSIRPRDVTRRQLSATPQQVTIVILLSAFVLPLFGFALAALTGWRRR